MNKPVQRTTNRAQPVPFVVERELERHPIAEHIPLPNLAEEQEALSRSITAEQGVKEPITLFEDKVLDGWLRYMMARKQGRMVQAIRLEDIAHGHNDIHGFALRYVIRKNIARRHYAPTHRALIAYHLANARQGERTDLSKPSADLPILTQADAAVLCQTSVRNVSNVARVLRENNPRHVEAMYAGKPLEPIVLGIRWHERMRKANLRSLSHYAKPQHEFLICGNALGEMRKRQDGSFDACVCDPPYGINLNKQWDKEIPRVEYWQEVFRLLKPGAFCLVFSYPHLYDRLASLVRSAGFEIQDMVYWVITYKMSKANHLRPAHEPICIAQKPYERSIEYNMKKWGVGRINGDDPRIDKSKYTNVVGYLDDPRIEHYFYAPRVTEQEKGFYNDHPSVKPIALMKWLIGIYVPDNGIVLDPFMGSGTTGLAAIEAGCRFVGIDISPHYVQIARRRFEDHGKLALGRGE
jgi:site-specific DNA-methyltransferase (adenine-specific)